MSLTTIRATPIRAINAIIIFLFVTTITMKEIITTISIPIAESIKSTYYVDFQAAGCPPLKWQLDKPGTLRSIAWRSKSAHISFHFLIYSLSYLNGVSFLVRYDLNFCIYLFKLSFSRKSKIWLG